MVAINSLVLFFRVCGGGAYVCAHLWGIYVGSHVSMCLSMWILEVDVRSHPQ